jgi:hypothetical protein
MQQKPLSKRLLRFCFIEGDAKQKAKYEANEFASLFASGGLGKRLHRSLLVLPQEVDELLGEHFVIEGDAVDDGGSRELDPPKFPLPRLEALSLKRGHDSGAPKSPSMAKVISRKRLAGKLRPSIEPSRKRLVPLPTFERKCVTLFAVTFPFLGVDFFFAVFGGMVALDRVASTRTRRRNTRNGTRQKRCLDTTFEATIMPLYVAKTSPSIRLGRKAITENLISKALFPNFSDLAAACFGRPSFFERSPVFALTLKASPKVSRADRGAKKNRRARICVRGIFAGLGHRKISRREFMREVTGA